MFQFTCPIYVVRKKDLKGCTFRAQHKSNIANEQIWQLGNSALQPDKPYRT